MGVHRDRDSVEILGYYRDYVERFCRYIGILQGFYRDVIGI